MVYIAISGSCWNKLLFHLYLTNQGNCKTVLFYIGAVTRGSEEGRTMVTLESLEEFQNFKSCILDAFSAVVTQCLDRIRLAEEENRINPFINRTNVYRAEDGRPICYCCLRVGHVAKYCHDRMYSCYHLGNETTRQ